MNVPKNNPFTVVRPRDRTLGQLSASMDSLIKKLCWDLGERYDAVLRNKPQYGTDWLAKLSAYRNKGQQHLHDPSFVLAEAERYPNSPVWQALPPRTPKLVGLLRRARMTRNYWQHRAVKQDFGTYKQGVLHYRALAEALGFSDIVLDTDALLERIEAIKEHGRVFSGPGPSVIAEMEARLAHEQDKVQQAQARLEAQQAQVAAGAEITEQLQEQLNLQKEALVAAQDSAAALRAQIYEMMQVQRLKAVEPAAHLSPGDEWQGDLGSRVLLLKKHMRNLVDPDRKVMLSDEVGQVAKDAATRWLKFMPQGGRVHLTEGGNAAGAVAGRYIYLGPLDLLTDEAEAREYTSNPEFAASLSRRSRTAHMLRFNYEITADGDDVFQYGTDRLLSSVLGVTDARQVAEQLCGDIDPLVVFRVMSDGTVVISRDGQMQRVATVDLEYWFPVAMDRSS